MNVYIIEGGIGKHVFFTSMIKKLAEKSARGKIIVMSSYPDIFENNPLVLRSLSRNTPYVYEDLILNKDNQIYFADPYFDSGVIQNKTHVIESWSTKLNIEYNKEDTPKIYPMPNLQNDARKFKKENGKFIIVQFQCGQSPLEQDFKEPYKYQGFERSIPFDVAQKIIDGIKENYPDLTIVNFTLPNEYSSLKNCIRLDAPYLFYHALLEEAETFIGINSCLMHFAGALNKTGIVLWGGTSPKVWGYDFHINLSGSCSQNNLYCSRPFLRDLGDFNSSGEKWQCPNPTCMNIEPEEILSNLKTLIN